MLTRFVIRITCWLVELAKQIDRVKLKPHMAIHTSFSILYRAQPRVKSKLLKIGLRLKRAERIAF